MSFFEWGDDLSVGNEVIDRDHFRLIRLVNELHTATQRGDGRAVVGKILDDLLDYTREHFQREELHMQRINYAMLDAHKKEHAALLKKVLILRTQYEFGKFTVAAKVSELLREWLSIHIMRSDKAFATAASDPAQHNPGSATIEPRSREKT